MAGMESVLKKKSSGSNNSRQPPPSPFRQRKAGHTPSAGSSNHSSGMPADPTASYELRPKSTTSSSDHEAVGTRASAGGGGRFSSLRSWKSQGSGSKKPSKALQTAAALIAPTILEASLLHGVTTKTLLENCAVAFRSQEFHVEQHYSKSFETDRLGDFISHDWASGRFGKLFALGLVYNSVAAMTAALIVSVVLFILQYGERPVMPPPPFTAREAFIEGDKSLTNIALVYGFWNTVIAPVVFLVFFLYWQDMRMFLGLRKRTCFLDKYCIDQANPERKAAGILGLAGFLRCSDRIVICWTPRYFTRLWCTYEVASWLHLEKPLDSVAFMPLAHAQILMTMTILFASLYAGLAIMSPIFPQYYMVVLWVGIMIGMSLVMHMCRRAAMHLRNIKQQLMTFSVTNAKCFCCTVGHVTATGEPMACDREVVYSTIAEWFNDPDDDETVTQMARLDRFDQAVRAGFATRVLEMAGPTQLSYRYVIVVGLPFVMRAVDVLMASQHLPREWTAHTLIQYSAQTFFMVPFYYKAMMIIACWLDTKVGKPRSMVLDTLVTLGSTLASTIFFTIMAYLPWDFINNSGLPPVASAGYAGFVGILVAWAYWPDLRDLLLALGCDFSSQSRSELAGEQSKGDEGKDSVQDERAEVKDEKAEEEDSFEMLDHDIYSIRSI